MPLHLIEYKGLSILKQLQLEEALLRVGIENVCLINQGTNLTIVMGQSSDPKDLLDLERVRKDKIPIIKRFSGGGTVIVDHETILISFIATKSFLKVAPFPEPILRWSAELYKSAWGFSDFSLTEHDYTLGSLKCGGNAQYFSKDRFVHHTSFLWDFSLDNMAYLRLPAKRPQYREHRSHQEFLCKLSKRAPSQERLLSQFKDELAKHFSIHQMPQEELEKVLLKEHRKSTHKVE